MAKSTPKSNAKKSAAPSKKGPPPKAAKKAARRPQKPVESATVMDLLEHDLSDLYSAEQQALKAYPRMIRAAKHPELKQAFETHMAQTEGQVERLDRIFEMIGTTPERMKCKAMQGLVAEAQDAIAEYKGDEVHIGDLALIGSAQKAEHYEIASYGTACNYAKDLADQPEVAQLLHETLDEEKQTDELLTQVAERIIAEHQQEGGDEGEEEDENA